MQEIVQDAIKMLLILKDTPGPFGKSGQAIASHLYLTVTEGDIHRFQMAKGLLVDKGWVTATQEIVSITEAGVAKAEEIDALLGAAE